MENTYQMKSLQGKVLITGILKVETGMHIGGGNDYAPIGSVDSPFIRNPLTHEPIIPGSSLKGKMRTLLAKMTSESYILHSIDNDSVVLKRLFGFAGKNRAAPARLQFFDLFMTEKSKALFENVETDTYMGEVKFENTISRTTGSANPRQIERVPAGAEFQFKVVYNVESEEEAEEDFKLFRQGIELLQADYLGGHGSRGYGRISFKNFTVRSIGNYNLDMYPFEEIIYEVENDGEGQLQ